jgi:hypothetical protein
MTVAQLIEKLKEFPENMEVIIIDVQGNYFPIESFVTLNENELSVPLSEVI